MWRRLATACVCNKKGSRLKAETSTYQICGSELLLTGLYALQRNIQDIITQDNDLDSDVGMNLIQLLGGSNDFYGIKRRCDSCTSASSNDSILSGRCTLRPLPNRPSCALPLRPNPGCLAKLTGIYSCVVEHVHL